MITRRDFNRGIVAAAAGLLLPPAVKAKPAKPDWVFEVKGCRSVWWEERQVNLPVGLQLREDLQCTHALWLKGGRLQLINRSSGGHSYFRYHMEWAAVKSSRLLSVPLMFRSMPVEWYLSHPEWFDLYDNGEVCNYLLGWQP